MIPFRSTRMDLMSSKDVAKYLKKNDAVILPLGCFEMHGPRVPLNCDSFLDWAGALLLGERWKCLVMPPVTYTYPGASGPWPGTVNVSPDITIAYIKEIARALLKNGFGKVMLCSSHGPNMSAMQVIIASLFHETDRIVVALSPWKMLRPEDLIRKEFGERFEQVTEDVFVLGALKLLGLHGAYDPSVKVAKPMEFPYPVVSSFAPHAGSGSVPWLFRADYQHTGLRKGVTLDDAERAANVMRGAAKRMPDLLKFYAQYQKEVAKTLKEKPWKKESAWSV